MMSAHLCLFWWCRCSFEDLVSALFMEFPGERESERERHRRLLPLSRSSSSVNQPSKNQPEERMTGWSCDVVRGVPFPPLSAFRLLFKVLLVPMDIDHFHLNITEKNQITPIFWEKKYSRSKGRSLKSIIHISINIDGHRKYRPHAIKSTLYSPFRLLYPPCCFCYWGEKNDTWHHDMGENMGVLYFDTASDYNSR